MDGEKIKSEDLIKHKTKRNVLIRFLLVLLVVIVYFAFAIGKFGLSDGFLVTLLTWSLFVFGTPIADAGFLLDFPVRIITKIKMIYSEIFVWTIATSLNLFALFFNPNVYQKTLLLKLLSHILTNPFPYWLIIILSGFGTFLSVYFGDELLDVTLHSEREKYKKHKRKQVWILIIFIMVLIISIYYFLLNELGLTL